MQVQLLESQRDIEKNIQSTRKKAFRKKRNGSPPFFFWSANIDLTRHSELVSSFKDARIGIDNACF
jgi:hypothetical protein